MTRAFVVHGPPAARPPPRFAYRLIMAYKQSFLQDQPWPRGGGCTQDAEHHQDRGDIAGQAIDAEQDCQGAGHARISCTSVVISGKSRWALMTPPSHSVMARPWPWLARPATDQFHPELVRLDVLQVHLALLDHVLMHRWWPARATSAMRSRTFDRRRRQWRWTAVTTEVRTTVTTSAAVCKR